MPLRHTESITDALGNLLLALLTAFPVAYVVRDAWPLKKDSREILLWDWLFRVVLRPGSSLFLFGLYVAGVAGAGPFSESPGWSPIIAALYIGFLALAAAGRRAGAARSQPS